MPGVPVEEVHGSQKNGHATIKLLHKEANTKDKGTEIWGLFVTAYRFPK